MKRLIDGWTARASSAFAPLAPALDDAAGHWRRSPLPAFFAWWRSGLLACLPQRWRQLIERTDIERLLYVELGNASQPAFIAGLQAASQRMPTSTAQDRTDEGRCILLLPRRAVLVKPLRLPLAARDTLLSTLSYDLDRQTPFEAEHIAFDARIVGETHAMLDVELIVVTRAALAPLIAQVAAAGVSLHGIDVVGDDAQRMKVNLLPEAQRATQIIVERRRNRWLLVATLLLSCIALMQWQSERAARADEMQAHVDSMRTQALTVMRLRNQLRDQLSAASYLSRLKTSRPGLDTVLLQLTNALADDSWLQQLEVDPDGAVNMTGFSAHATAIISRLKSADSVKNVQFQGVIEPDATTHLDHFYLSAKLNGE